MPGLLMGIMQFCWLAVNSAVSTSFILQAFNADASAGTPQFIIVAIIWTVLAVFVALKGIQYVGRVSTFLPIVPLVMILIVFFTNVGSAGGYTPPAGGNTTTGLLTVVAIVVGFFASAGAAGVDFGMGNRDKRDVQLGGLAGIALAIIIAGGLPLIAVAGAHAKDPTMQSYLFDAVIRQQGGFLAKIMFILFAVASFAPACFSTFIAANSIGTMFPKANKVVAVSIGGIVAIILAATGWALQIVEMFMIIGASFGPICGAMVADYFLSGRKWSGPRKGVNLAGYISWAVGFIVAILPSAWVGGEKFAYINPAPVIAFVIGFVLYVILAKIGLQPPTVEMTQNK
jgi:cytosine permease